ncbi:uncharacterized protein A4U43_C10F18540 [Asparagus officinalis]|uniref:Uncharacterized protein n=1 Tax=Asparagus officinalis TaxID=4686 RepID=A0A5P1E494_ASPOF|nr:uncharacterized protein A4U43_C10F18540 [Asparagus officinalis]
MHKQGSMALVSSWHRINDCVSTACTGAGLESTTVDSVKLRSEMLMQEYVYIWYSLVFENFKIPCFSRAFSECILVHADNRSCVIFTEKIIKLAFICTSARLPSQSVITSENSNPAFCNGGSVAAERLRFVGGSSGAVELEELGEELVVFVVSLVALFCGHDSLHKYCLNLTTRRHEQLVLSSNCSTENKKAHQPPAPLNSLLPSFRSLLLLIRCSKALASASFTRPESGRPNLERLALPPGRPARVPSATSRPFRSAAGPGLVVSAKSRAHSGSTSQRGAPSSSPFRRPHLFRRAADHPTSPSWAHTEAANDCRSRALASSSRRASHGRACSPRPSRALTARRALPPGPLPPPLAPVDRRRPLRASPRQREPRSTSTAGCSPCRGRPPLQRVRHVRPNDVETVGRYGFAFGGPSLLPDSRPQSEDRPAPGHLFRAVGYSITADPTSVRSGSTR